MAGWGKGRRRRTAEGAGDGSRRAGGVRRLPLRTVLLIVVIVPSVTFTPLLASGMRQLAGQWQEEKAQLELATTTVGRPAAGLFFALDQERRLTAKAQASPGAAARDKLAGQRAATDRAVQAFPTADDLDLTDAQPGLAAALRRAERDLGLLDQQRRAVDAGWSSPQQTFDYYSGVLETDLGVLTALSHTGESQVNIGAQPLVDLLWIIDLLGREDALLTRGWDTGRLTRNEYALVTEALGTRNHLMHARVLPALTGQETRYATITGGEAWRTMTAVEGRLATAASGSGRDQVRLGDDGAAWRSSVASVTAQLRQLAGLRFAYVSRVGHDHADMIFTVFVSISTVGLLALALVILTSWRVTAVLRRRILRLRQEAQELQERLPDVVARLERGEDVDADAEVRAIEPTGDELGELGQALNVARRSAVRTAVRQAEQHRGFQRMLQRIARRTQILIGLQLKKLDELERKHEDPAVLEGLFDLDHLTARLRRYEENLVILGGGQPQRRWRNPVRLLDVLRAAQSEVQDYRRISIEVEGEYWIAERAVGPMIHVLAELMENATTFSKPLTPVEVRSTPVSKGVAVEIEDRGLGMEPEQYAAVNALLQAPPQLDVMTHADDVRLGLYVVARLAAGLGLQVELRPSAFGGTRVIVLLPETMVVDRPRTAEPDPPEEDRPRAGALPTRTRGHALATVAAPAPAAPSPAAAPERENGGPRPLPQRVRQASLAEELKAPAETPGDQEEWAAGDRPSRSSAVIGAFQRQSRLRRTGEEAFPAPPGGSPDPMPPTTEDR
ncbi:nitrate- and nitrite sensing domain-containing protein [Actinomadura sp. ATCC 31491]|uniref:histidine kinase n=1 Tax=Actinomadura luzonensis TaxID=2805427 RepID=A0ABT0FTL1_9ACTN|nr:nitrate- and nitrite sensing domain-containing protein [Actinomadura luzonensis]MCK2215675.1 nitrate- and nitrite sensing domain-containing protein [Actinomadura luzonensis]